MKAAALCAVIIFLCTAAFPLALFSDGAVSSAMADIFEDYYADSPIATEYPQNFRIKDSSTGKIETVPADTYVIGVLCGELSPSYSKEVLKAQAVAAYTFAVRRSMVAKGAGRDYDLTDSCDTDQCYIKKSVMYEKWGDNADKYYSIFESAVKDVKGQLLLYDNQPALTVYHAISSGVTNSSKDVWGSELAYLVSVDSVGDKLSKDYLSEFFVSESEMAEKLKGTCTVTPGANLFSDMDISGSGRVISVNVNGEKIPASEIVSQLSLKSGNFEVTYRDGGYYFTVKGRGHGVGMSQNGAEYMSLQGSNYEEILLHYYPGCTLKK